LLDKELISCVHHHRKLRLRRQVLLSWPSPSNVAILARRGGNNCLPEGASINRSVGTSQEWTVRSGARIAIRAGAFRSNPIPKKGLSSRGASDASSKGPFSACAEIGTVCDTGAAGGPFGCVLVRAKVSIFGRCRVEGRVAKRVPSATRPGHLCWGRTFVSWNDKPFTGHVEQRGRN
jgi:hypothetical protein